MTTMSVSQNPQRVRGEERGLRKRLFAWTLHKFNGGYEREIAARKRELLGGLKGTVIEIGPGSGPNLRYYANTVRWIGIEPNFYMRGYLKREAERTGVKAELRDGRAGAMECADDSADAVVARHRIGRICGSSSRTFRRARPDRAATYRGRSDQESRMVQFAKRASRNGDGVRKQ